MHQQLKLSEHLKYEKKELQHMSCEVRDLEMKLDRRQLQLRAKLTVAITLKFYFESYNNDYLSILLFCLLNDNLIFLQNSSLKTNLKFSITWKNFKTIVKTLQMKLLSLQTDEVRFELYILKLLS